MNATMSKYRSLSPKGLLQLEKRLYAVCSYRTYDVLCNARDGYEVNDSYSHDDIEVNGCILIHNMYTHVGNGGTSSYDGTFVQFYLTDGNIRKALGLRADTVVNSDDGVTYEIEDRRGRPIGNVSVIEWRERS